MPRPRTIHDFYGFPQPLFDVEYPAPGSPELAEEVADIVKPTHVGLDQDSWGIDHGTWSVLVHAFPDADIPVVQLSIHALRDFDSHFELGARLAPLARARRAHRRQRQRRAQPARPELVAARPRVRLGPSLRRRRARGAHRASPATRRRCRAMATSRSSAPTPDHFIPLLYIAGLAGAAKRPLEPLVDGYAFGSLSMASYTLDAKRPGEGGDRRPSAGLPDPSLTPAEDANV